MITTISKLKKGQKAIIKEFDIEKIPLKLIEMGCLPESVVEVQQIAPFGDPIFLSIDDTQLSIRQETAQEIVVELSQETNE